MYCSNCGKEIDEQSKFCKYCGSKVVKEEAPKVMIVEKQKRQKPWLTIIMMMVFGVYLVIDGYFTFDNMQCIRRNFYRIEDFLHSYYSSYIDEDSYIFNIVLGSVLIILSFLFMVIKRKDKITKNVAK